MLCREEPMRKKLLGILYIVFTLGITVYICLYTADFSSLKQAVHNINWLWILGGLGCMLLYFFFEALGPILVLSLIHISCAADFGGSIHGIWKRYRAV